MAKYVLLLILETITYCLWIQYSTISNHVFWYVSILVFPIVYFSLSIFDVLNRKDKKFLYFVSFLNILTLLFIGFIKDGLTTFQTNPDSSFYGWIVLISALRFCSSLIELGCFIILRFLIDKTKNRHYA
jgi:hypothetical protein